MSLPRPRTLAKILLLTTALLIGANPQTTFAACQSSSTSWYRSSYGSYSSYYSYWSRPVGGVSLDKAAEFLDDMSEVSGAYFDQATNRIVIVGKRNTSPTPVFNKDDLATAIRSVVFNNTLPYVSIGDNAPFPFPPNFDVTYSNGIQNTYMGKVLFEADYYLKKLMIGEDGAGNLMAPPVPTYRSVSQRFSDLGGPTPGSTQGPMRFWISPKDMILQWDSASGAFVFSQTTMQVQNQPLTSTYDPRFLQASTAFSQELTANYNAYANGNEWFSKTKELAKVVSVVKWLKDANIVTDFSWAKNYSPTSVPTPSTAPKITGRVYSGTSSNFYIEGGADLSTPNSYVADNGQAGALKSTAQSTAPSLEANHWSFTQDGQVYDTVAVSANAFRSVGGYGTNVTDLSIDSTGDINVEFKRSYSSLSDAEQGIGKGWDFMPARLTNNHPWDVINAAPPGGYAGLYPRRLTFQTLEGIYESFTFDGNNYIPDKPHYYSKIVRNSDGSYKVYLKNQTYFHFSINFYLLIKKDKNLNGLYYQYDGTRIVRIEDDFSHQLNIGYTAEGRVASVSDWAGRSVLYGYDGAGRLNNVVDPRGKVSSYSYDGENRLTSITDRDGKTILTQSYNDKDKIDSSTNASGLTVSHTYDEDNRVVTSTDSNSRVNTTFYDDKGRITKQVDPAGNFIESTYGDHISPLTVKDKRGNTVTYTYDTNGNTTSVTYPDTTVINYQYDAKNNLTKISDTRYGGSPKVTDFTYDANGNLTSKKEATITTQYGYDEDGELNSSTDGLGHTTTYAIGEFGRRTAETIPSGATTNYAYDLLGRLVTKTDPLGKSQTMTYDANNNVLTVADSTGTTTNVYNSENRLVSVTTPDNRTTQFGYNNAGSQTSTTEPNASLTSYGYDQYENLTAKQDALTRTTQYAYDQLNRKTQSTSPMGKVAKWEYDANGNITKRIDESNRATVYEYDVLNRLKKVTYPDTSIVSFTHDARGNLTQINSPSGNSLYTYDIFDRLTKETDPHNEPVEYTYDNADNLAQIKYPDGKLTRYTYDASNRLKTVTDWNNQNTHYQYNQNGTLAYKRLPNGLVGSYSYDGANRLVSLEYSRDQKLVTRFVYERDAVGNVTKETKETPVPLSAFSVYNDALSTGWSSDWSWDSNVNLADTSNPYEGSKAISWQVTKAWGGLHLRKTDGLLNTAPYTAVSFAMKGTVEGQRVGFGLKGLSDQDLTPAVDLATYGGNPSPSGYKVFTIPLSALNAENKDVSAMYFTDLNGGPSSKNPPKIYIDSVAFTTQVPSAVPIYDDALLPNIDNWSWNLTPNFDDASAPFIGSRSIGLDFTNAWGGITLHNWSGFSTKGYSELTLAVKGSAQGQQLSIIKTNQNGDAVGAGVDLAQYGDGIDANSYVVYRVPLAALQAVDAQFYGLILQDESGIASQQLKVDDVKFIPAVTNNTNKEISTFAYDAVGRVTSATYPSGTYTYTYDAVGNRLASDEKGVQNSYAYNSDNQLTVKGSQTFSYDNQGNQTADSSGFRTFTYDFDNRLTQFKNLLSNSTINYKYDGAGNRIEKSVVGGATHRYVNDNSGELSRVLVAKNTTAGTNTFYVHGLGLESQGGASIADRQYYLNDGVGNVRSVMDNSGSTVQNYAYDPYGNETTGSNVSNYGFQGEQRDRENNLIYLRARYYDAKNGRFISKDPVEGILKNPQTQNGYNYANGNPINLSDPSGEFAFLAVLAVAWIVAETTYSVWSTYDNVKNCNYGWAAFDAASLLIPGIPAGLGRLDDVTRYGIRITRSGLDHVINRHTVSGALKAGNSVFNKGEDVAALVNQANGVTAVRQANGNYQRVVNAGRNIGIDRNTGRQTSVYTVITRPNGDLVTAYPGR